MMLEALSIGIRGHVGSQFNYAGDLYNELRTGFEREGLIPPPHRPSCEVCSSSRSSWSTLGSTPHWPASTAPRSSPTTRARPWAMRGCRQCHWTAAPPERSRRPSRPSVRARAAAWSTPLLKRRVAARWVRTRSYVPRRRCCGCAMAARLHDKPPRVGSEARACARPRPRARVSGASSQCVRKIPAPYIFACFGTRSGLEWPSKGSALTSALYTGVYP